MQGKPGLRIYLFRHGETDNAGKVCFNGHHDVDLSPEGRAQFERLAERFRALPIHSVYSSDLKRTRIGAELIAKPHGLTPAAYPELRELCFGAWEGMSVEEVNEKYPGQLAERLKNIAAFSVEGGENFFQLSERVIPRYEDIVARHKDGQIVIVAHGGVNRVILAYILGIPVKNLFRIQQEYGTLNIIQYYDGIPVAELIAGNAGALPAPAARKIAIQ